MESPSASKSRKVRWYKHPIKDLIFEVAKILVIPAAAAAFGHWYKQEEQARAEGEKIVEQSARDIQALVDSAVEFDTATNELALPCSPDGRKTVEGCAWEFTKRLDTQERLILSFSWRLKLVPGLRKETLASWQRLRELYWGGEGQPGGLQEQIRKAMFGVDVQAHGLMACSGDFQTAECAVAVKHVYDQLNVLKDARHDLYCHLVHDLLSTRAALYRSGRGNLGEQMAGSLDELTSRSRCVDAHNSAEPNVPRLNQAQLQQ